MEKLYQTNKDLRDYVDRYCRNYYKGQSITVEEALKHEQVREVAGYYKQLEREAQNRII